MRNQLRIQAERIIQEKNQNEANNVEENGNPVEIGQDCMEYKPTEM